METVREWCGNCVGEWTISPRLKASGVANYERCVSRRHVQSFPRDSFSARRIHVHASRSRRDFGDSSDEARKKKKKKNKTFPRAGRKVELDAASIEKNRRADRYSRLAAKRRARLTLGTVLWRVNTDYRAFPPLSLSLFSFFSFPLPRLVRIIKSRRASSIRFSAFSQRETGSPVRSPVG